MREVKRFVKENTNLRKTTELQSPVLRLRYGAGDETRTRDNLLGRQGLYQLSYSRIGTGFSSFLDINPYEPFDNMC